MSDIGLRGIALLDAAIAHVEAHPETHQQDRWRCGTGMCVAGWMCQLAGGEWAFPPEPPLAHFLVADSADSADPADYAGTQRVRGRIVIDAAARAERLLATSSFLDEDEHDGSMDDDPWLFGGDNSLADIKAIRDAIAARLAAVTS